MANPASVKNGRAVRITLVYLRCNNQKVESGAADSAGTGRGCKLFTTPTLSSTCSDRFQQKMFKFSTWLLFTVSLPVARPYSAVQWATKVRFTKPLLEVRYRIACPRPRQPTFPSLTPLPPPSEGRLRASRRRGGLWRGCDQATIPVPAGVRRLSRGAVQ